MIDCRFRIITKYKGGLMRVTIAIGMFLFMSGTAVFPSLTDAASLPAGGGEPGKAFAACIAAVSKPDKPAMVELCFAKDDPWITKTNLDYFTNETFQVEVRQQWPALRLIDVKIAGGQMESDTAEISVEGTMLLQRLESTGDIVEVDRKPMKGTVQLRLANGVWRYAGSQKLEAPE